MKNQRLIIIVLMVVGVGGLISSLNSPLLPILVTITEENSVENKIIPYSSAPEDFVSIWNTSLLSTGSSADNQIRLPLESGGSYDFTVDWGDTNSSVITSYNQAEVTHTYITPGVYTLTLTGTIIGWRFDNGGDKLKLIEIAQWGNLRLGNLWSFFDGCENLNLTAIDAVDLAGTTLLIDAFKNCKALGNNGDMNGWDISNVEIIRYMFAGATSFNQNIGGWDVSNVYNMQYMFDGATSFNQDIGGWDVSGAWDMQSMFDGATSFNQDIGGWNVNNVEWMQSMFSGATSFNQDIGEWDMLGVLDMHYMFDGASSFNQDIGEWDVSTVNSMYGMFRDATSFNQDIGGWDVSGIYSLPYMFKGATSFNQDIGGWDVSYVDNMREMFEGATSFDQDIGGWDVSEVTDMTDMFNGVALTTDNYDSILQEWALLSLQSGVTFNAGISQYSDSAASARQSIIDTFGWTIIDEGLETDWDSDGLSDFLEVNTYFTNPQLIDTDGDNFLDGYEVDYGSDPTDSESYPAIPEQWFESLNVLMEGNATLIQNLIDWSNGNETLLEITYALAIQNTAYLAALEGNLEGNVTEIRAVLEELGFIIGDTDYDGLDDLDEVLYNTSLTCADTDCDNLNDAFEVKIGTDPLNDDSDGDDWYDGVEVAAGTSPMDAADYPGSDNSSDNSDSDNDTDGNGVNSSFPTGIVIGGVMGLGALIGMVSMILIKRKK